MDIDTDYQHDGTTRQYWVADTLEKIMAEPWPNATTPPATFARAIERLMDKSDAINEDENREGALAQLNLALAREGSDLR